MGDDWSVGGDILEDLREAVRRLAVSDKPCLHPYILVDLSPIDGRPISPRCGACLCLLPVSQEELEQAMRSI